MTEQSVRPGEILFREGDASDQVGRLRCGEIEVVKRYGGQELVIGTIRAGEYFGEMGVLEGRPRSATLRARHAAVVEWMTAAAFLRRVSSDSSIALELLVRLSMRLRRTDTALTEAMIEPPPAETAVGRTRPQQGEAEATVVLRADSERIATLLPPEGHRISALPFFFGRVPRSDETPPPIGIDLTVAERPPCRLSTVHFAVMREEGRLVLRDLGTEFGTAVDGTLLGGDFGRHTFGLEPGEVRVVAGGQDSPFAFRLSIRGD